MWTQSSSTSFGVERASGIYFSGNEIGRHGVVTVINLTPASVTSGTTCEHDEDESVTLGKEIRSSDLKCSRRVRPLKLIMKCCCDP